ncbi:MAG TPA: menaquinol-cytochrome c reductase cytochrome b subunit [Acidimicrobiales bacterium]|nr:menaquinol-cytochrome c reductase cytochrome b subunit [Acidimicrobiales bacterium]
MTEVPEHLLRRSAERRAALGAAPAAGGPPPESGGAAPTPEGAPDTDPSGKIPAHLLARSQAATEAAQGAPASAAASAATAVATAPAPVAKGPEGHTQRLLTVVKAGSIQDVKATPTDKVHTWPHLLLGEFIAALACSAFLLIFSAVVNAPLLASANFNFTPNPSKAPWYFLGLQELLTMFHPMVAGVTIPGIGIFALMLAPYADKNPSNKPEDRKFAIALMTLFIMFWAVLVIIGCFFRGPGFNFTFPWHDGVFFDL